jgi:cob(I)alamin adenosyltransferase
VPKNSWRIEAIGSVDELNAWVGMVLASECEDRTRDLLLKIQKDLFVVGADLATPGVMPVRGFDDVPRVREERIDEIEAVIDELQSELDRGVGVVTAFILPGGCESGARLHGCRGVCRRAERVCVWLMDEVFCNGNDGSNGDGDDARYPSLSCCVKFLNRLSDLFFVMARWENMKKGVAEVKWMGR